MRLTGGVCDRVMKIDRDAAWAAIVGHYARPGVADELLHAQQASDLDIVLFLFFRYLEQDLHQVFDGAARAEARAAIESWRNAAIKPLRAMRRSLKEMAGLDAIDATHFAFRESLKQMELTAERIEFLSLCNWLEGRSKP